MGQCKTLPYQRLTLDLEATTYPNLSNFRSNHKVDTPTLIKKLRGVFWGLENLIPQTQ